MFYMFSCIVKIYGKIKYSKESQQNMSQFSCYYSCAHNTVSSANIRQTEDSVSSAGYNDRFHRISAKIWSLSPASLSGNPWFTTRSTGVAPISFEISGPLLLWARSPPASGPPRPRPLLLPLPPPQPQPLARPPPLPLPPSPPLWTPLSPSLFFLFWLLPFWLKTSELTCCIFIVLKPDCCVYNKAIMCLCTWWLCWANWQSVLRKWHLDILPCLMYTSVSSVLQSLCVLFCKKCEAEIVLIVALLCTWTMSVLKKFESLALFQKQSCLIISSAFVHLEQIRQGKLNQQRFSLGNLKLKNFILKNSFRVETNISTYPFSW